MECLIISENTIIDEKRAKKQVPNIQCFACKKPNTTKIQKVNNIIIHRHWSEFNPDTYYHTYKKEKNEININSNMLDFSYNNG
jgi:hypothetical protein